MIDTPLPGNRTMVKTISQEFPCTPQQVFDVLVDGWLYASWVVGASRIRDVDRGWPVPGTRIHHSVGAWPALIDDITVAKEYEPPRKLRLRARAWPAGEAEVVIAVVPSPQGCTVTMSEDAVSGPGRLIPAPVRHLMIGRRNREALNRLELLAKGRAARPDQPKPTG